MVKELSEIKNGDHLPYVHFLDSVKPSDIFAFGTGTFKYEPKDEGTQLNAHLEFIKRYAASIEIDWYDLKWILRMEGGKPSGAFASDYGKVRRHNHFVLFRDGVESTNLEARQLLSRCRKAWRSGIDYIEEYDGQKFGWAGIGYLLKAPLGMRSEDYGDTCIFAPALWQGTMKQYQKEEMEVLHES